ncbi:hypothetical protein AVEN_61278-1, partial [Araneus ventricosus]
EAVSAPIENQASLGFRPFPRCLSILPNPTKIQAPIEYKEASTQTFSQPDFRPKPILSIRSREIQQGKPHFAGAFRKENLGHPFVPKGTKVENKTPVRDSQERTYKT